MAPPQTPRFTRLEISDEEKNSGISYRCSSPYYLSVCVWSLLSVASFLTAFLVLTFFLRKCIYTVYNSEPRKHLDNLNMIQSFSAKGHPYDNAVMECFFKYLKKEETNRRSYSSLDELKISLFKYIFGFYNSTCPHSNNGGLSTDDFENL